MGGDRWQIDGSRRRNHLSRGASRWVIAVAAASGMFATTAGCRPTGVRALDVAWTGTYAAVVTWAGATTPWWVLAVCGIVGVAVAPSAGVSLACGVAAIVAMMIGLRHVSNAVSRAVVAAVVVQSLLRLQIESFGLSAVVAGVIAAWLFVAGASRRTDRVRLRILVALAGAAGLVLISLLGFGIAVLRAKGALTEAQTSVSEGLGSLRSGDAGQATARLDDAARSLRRASGALRLPAYPAKALPVLSQHARALSDVTRVASESAASAAQAVTAMNPGAIRFKAGSVDANAIALLDHPLRESRDAVGSLERVLTRAPSPWMVAPLRDRLRQLLNLASAARRQGDVAIRVARLSASMLGRDGPRTYFVAFVTPAEARGLGGFMGNFAEVVAVDGSVTVTRFGRTLDLAFGGKKQRTLTGPADYLARYGRFGANSDNGHVDLEFWDNVTMSPDLPSVSQVIAELYPQSGGTDIDGVIVIDPVGIRALTRLTGPLRVERAGITLTPDNIVPFLLSEQYERFPDDDPARKDALADVASVALQALLGASSPSPEQLGQTVSPAIQEGHIQIWSLLRRDQEDLRWLGVSGELSRRRGEDGLAVTVANAAPNKIDTYLTKVTRYDAIVDPTTNGVTATVEVTLTNDLPPRRLPEVVVGNALGEPTGTNIAFVSVYTPLTLLRAQLNGQAREMLSEQELGWNVYSLVVRVPPGGSATLELALRGEIDLTKGYRLFLRPQPAGVSEGLALDVRTLSGDAVVRRRQKLEAPIRLTSPL